MTRTWISRFGAMAAAAVAAWGVSRADTPGPPAPAAQPLRLLQDSRIGDAIDASEASVARAPQDSLACQVRGLIALTVGDLPRARRSYHSALDLTPDDPAALYGGALCALFRKDWVEADVLLRSASERPLPPEQAADVQTARAYLRYLKGDAAGCLALIPAASVDPFAQELRAFATARISPSQGETLLAQFVARPQVREADGVRALFSAEQPLEPSIQERPLREVYRARFVSAERDAAKSGGSSIRLSGLDSIVITNDVSAQLWSLLRLQPARKAAEWTLAGLQAKRGDRENAAFHRLMAAALDPDYLTARQSAKALLEKKSDAPNGLWRVFTKKKVVALTFDDGPNPQKTPALIDALDSVKAPATWFIVGRRAEEAPDLVRRMSLRGDDVENHSYSHFNMDQVNPTMAEEEILRNSVLIRALTGRQPRFFRPPGGNGGPTVNRMLADYGLTAAMWTVDAFNLEQSGSAKAVTNYVLAHVHPGSIVLMHNGPDVDAEAVPDLVRALRARGYTLVTMSQLVNTK